MQSALLVEDLNPLLETQFFTPFTQVSISLSACGRDFARMHRAKASVNNESSESFKAVFTISHC